MLGTYGAVSMISRARNLEFDFVGKACDSSKKDYPFRDRQDETSTRDDGRESTLHQTETMSCMTRRSLCGRKSLAGFVPPFKKDNANAVNDDTPEADARSTVSQPSHIRTVARQNGPDH